MKTVNDVMSEELVKSPASDTVATAAKQMRRRGVGAVVVFDPDEPSNVVGIVTDRDITIRVTAEGRDPDKVELVDVCTSDPLTIESDADAQAAATMMRTRAVRRLLVMADGEPVGVVSIGDLAAALDPESALGEISAAPGEGPA